ncbi:hypothetical protein U879_12630 [Defluviimonas sp. 20V17]|nr:hypothetical protein U879_12630 [Defluviimonas sp. 20V17]
MDKIWRLADADASVEFRAWSEQGARMPVG